MGGNINEKKYITIDVHNARRHSECVPGGDNLPIRNAIQQGDV